MFCLNIYQYIFDTYHIKVFLKVNFFIKISFIIDNLI